MGKLVFCLQFLKRIFFLFALFVLLSLQNSLAVYVADLVSCFPVTLITTQKEPVEQTLSRMKLCSVSVQSERMTFDSSMFNHYETLPVKEIYLYSAKIPYQNWNEIKNMEDVIPEANPYIEEIVSFYEASKVKCYLVSFVFMTILGIYFVFKFLASNKMTKKQFVAVSIIITVLYIACSVLLIYAFPPFLMSFSAASAGVLFMAYIFMTLMNYKMLKR